MMNYRIMDNPFRKILTDEKVPEILREKVLDDLTLVKFSLDVADLFAVKYPITIKELLMTEQEVLFKKKTK